MSGRLYENLEEAIREIKRDIYKSAITTSLRVQNLAAEAEVHEALNYQYSVLNVPGSLLEMVEMALEFGFISPIEKDDFLNWAWAEISARMYWAPSEITEKYNPHLAKVIEGPEPS